MVEFAPFKSSFSIHFGGTYVGLLLRGRIVVDLKHPIDFTATMIASLLDLSGSSYYKMNRFFQREHHAHHYCDGD